MKTQFTSRKAALAVYLHARKTWSREVAFYKAIVRFGHSPIQRLACAITLAKFGVDPK